MSITKAVLLTMLLLFLEISLQLLSFIIFDTNYGDSDHISGGTLIISRVIAYLIIFCLFWKPEIKKLTFRSNTLSLPVIFFIFLIIIGTELLNRPFADIPRLLDNTPVNFIYEGFSIYLIYGAITALLIAPVFEELFFRKYLFKKLLIKNSFLTGLLVSSFLFSIIHWETPLNLIPAFLMGLISALIFYKTGNIIYCILLHFLYNLTSQIFYYKAELYSEWLNWLNFGILYWSLFVFGIFIILYALHKIPYSSPPVTWRR